MSIRGMPCKLGQVLGFSSVQGPWGFRGERSQDLYMSREDAYEDGTPRFQRFCS